MTSRADRLLVALALSAGPLIALGLARFAYALLLPDMAADLGWSWSQAGALNTANAAGYLVGALVAAPLARRVGTGRAFLLGAALTTVSLLLTALTSAYAVLLVARTVAGLGGAWAFVLGAALVAAAGAGGTPGRAALMLGLYYGGAGGGMTLAGLLVPWVLDRGPSAATSAGLHLAGWQLGWLTLTALAVVATLVAARALRHTVDPQPPRAQEQRFDQRRIGWLSAAYTFFGLGYIAYLTFIIAFLQEAGVGLRTVAAFWVVVGVAASGGWLAWGRLIGRLGGARSMAVLLVVLAAGTALPVLVPQTWSFFVSGAVVGGTFLSVVTAMTVGVRESLPSTLWTSGLAFATVAFGAGQTAGPWLTGWFSDVSGSLGAGLVLSAVLLLVGAVLTVPQARRTGAPSTT
ncbi:YbfB/YjiJ family MFS transporter [Ornithinimicrobium avium]|uniref:YbfB/YjiJ family MFS transporter n=1 Tax=Ornithinimicrobium avium TaxID=2283195 RepID=A0A345NMJ3_9MICO|nr:YbfB/YjiJ family MFS transporter [Ornithinimicrobium avium]AXH96251.1 YbfB/YjiJ family MFS transporter [Ornithinimicrobium avium]